MVYKSSSCLGLENCCSSFLVDFAKICHRMVSMNDHLGIEVWCIMA